MPLAIDADYTLFDNLESVTYQQRTAEGTYAAGVALGSVLFEAYRKREQAAPLLFAQQEATFHLWKAALAGVVPKAGDRVTRSDATKWIIDRVDAMSWGTRYDCQAIKER